MCNEYGALSVGSCMVSGVQDITSISRFYGGWFEDAIRQYNVCPQYD